MCCKPQVFVTSLIFFETDVSFAFEADDAVASGLKEEVNLLAAKFPRRCPPCCLLRFCREHNARVHLTFADRSVWLQQALRLFAIVCDYMETALFAIVCDLRSAIRDRLRSFAIIWKPALSKRVFETRTATGSELFFFLTCLHTTTFTLPSIFFLH